MMRERLTTTFLKVAGILLLLTAAAKVVSATSELKILGQRDPLFTFLTNRQLLILVAAVEIAVGATILFRRVADVTTHLPLVAWLSTMFMAYRTGVFAIGYKGACRCLGHIGRPIGLSEDTVDLFMKGILLCLMFFSYGLLIWNWKYARSITGQTAAAAESTE